MPESVGQCVSNIGAIAALVNEAQERLINDPLAPDEGWWGGWVKMAFNVYPPWQSIVTPINIARVIVMDICKQPVRIRNNFYEYLQFGIGLQPRGCNTAACGCNQPLEAYERETVVSTTGFSGPKLVRAYPIDAGDVGKRVLVQGKDQNGMQVYTTDPYTQAPISGEYIVLGFPFVTTVNTFSTLDGLQKDLTLNDVTLVQVDPVTATETDLVKMEANQQTSQYRTYFINGLKNNCCASTPIQVIAQCKLD